MIIYNKKVMDIYKEIVKMTKINKFNGEIRTKDGTFLILDGEFGVGIDVKVMTSEGPVDLIDGPYVLGPPYDGVIIEVVKGKVKLIINPLKNEPSPNPLETPPMLADGAIGIVGQGMMSKETKETMEAKFEDTKVTTAADGTQNQSGDQATVETDKTAVYTVEELSSKIDDLFTQLKDLSDRLTKLEGGTDQATQSSDTAPTTDTTASKMSAEVKEQVDKQMKEFFEKNTPVKTSIFRMEADEQETIANDPVLARVKQLETIKKIKK